MHTAIHWRLQEGFKTRKDNCLFVFSHQIYQTTPTFPLCLLLLRTKPTTTLWFGWGTERKGVEEKVCLAHQPPSLKVDTDSHIIFSHMPLLLVCGQHRLPHMPLASCYYLQKLKKNPDGWWRNGLLIDFLKQILARWWDSWTRTSWKIKSDKIRILLQNYSNVAATFVDSCAVKFRAGARAKAISGPARQWWGRF